VDRVPPQSVSGIPSSRTRIAACRAPLLRLACSPKTSPASWRPTGSALPPCGSSRFVVCRRRAPSVLPEIGDLPRASAPLQSLTRSPPAPLGAVALPGFPTPTALPSRRDPPLPGFACPGHVASPHLPCASTPCSLVGLPGCSPGALTGLAPFRASPDRDRPRLSALPPLLRSACPRTVFRKSSARRVSPAWLRFRGFFPLPVGASIHGSLRGRRPGSPGLLPPWGFPLCRPWTSRRRIPRPYGLLASPGSPSASGGFRRPLRPGMRSVLLPGTSG